MLGLVLLIHIFVGATLSGVGIVCALLLGFTSGWGLAAVAAVGFFAAFPVAWWIEKAIRTNLR